MKKFLLLGSLFLLCNFVFAEPQDLSWWNDSSHSGTRKDPYQLREKATFDIEPLFNRFNISMGISGVVRGEEATKYLKFYRKSNDEPEQGKEYIMIYIYLDVNKDYSGEDKPFDVALLGCDLLTTKGTTIANTDCFVICKDALTGEVYEGSDIEGFLIYEIPQDTDVMLRTNKKFFILGTTTAFREQL